MDKQPPPKRLANFIGLSFILILFWTLTIAHSLIVPITQGEDELAHYRYIAFIAQTGRLPINQAEREAAWYRADWPPLYHLIVGAIVSPLDTTRPHLKDVGEASHRRLVGEIFYPRLIIYTEDANWPWQDGILAWHIGRFLSILFASMALVVTYFTAYQLHGEWRMANSGWRIADGEFAMLVTALLAFTPRFIFTSAMLGDDSLFILLSSIYIWILLRLLWGKTLKVSDTYLYTLSGLVIGLSIATKYSTGLLPFAILPVVWWRRRQASWTWLQASSRVAIHWVCTVLGASWWFGWIAYHFNTIQQDGLVVGLLYPILGSGPDVSMNRIFAFLQGQTFSGQERPDAIASGNFSGWSVYLFETFWGVPVLEYDPVFPSLYIVMLGFIGLSGYGLWRLWRMADSSTRMTLATLLTIIALLIPFPILRFFLTYNILETGQGRHILYPAAQSIPILLMWGWLVVVMNRGWRMEDGGTKDRTVTPPSSILLPLSSILPILLLIWSAGQLIYMARTYPDPLPIQTTTFDESLVPYPVSHQLTDSIRLIGHNLEPNLPYNGFDLTLIWQADDVSEQNYRVQLELTNLADNTVFRWLSHPVNGLYPTRAWDADDVIYDTIFLPLNTLPADRYNIKLNLLPQASHEPVLVEPIILTQFIWLNTPSEQESTPIGGLLDYRIWGNTDGTRQHQTIAVEWESHRPATVEWGMLDENGDWYPPTLVNDNLALFMVTPHWRHGQYRLELTSELNDTGSSPKLTLETEPILTVAAEPRQFYFTPPADWTPVEANFANQVKLLGYSLPSRRVQAGGGLPITLYWQSLAPVLGDYHVFDKLLDENFEVFGGYDRLPREYYSTILWANEEVVEDGFGIPVQPDAPDGIYQLHVGLYSLETGEPVSLPIMQDGQISDISSVVIGPIKVGHAPPDVTTDAPNPAVTLNQPFGDMVTLLGYTLNQTDEQLSLTLYWQANMPLPLDYTTFLHLRNPANENVAGMDRPPANGRYPTSLWDAGDIIVDEITLPLNDVLSGDYTPTIGLYDPHTFQRLPVGDNPAMELRLDMVTIQ
ncbi:hypothetical protein QUF63_08105 [Anaerolineales bacterium HSG25]|nr:hypothetical protein [Anaerolineales bacterium HSG25]